MRVLSLDLSTTCTGVAFFETNGKDIQLLKVEAIKGKDPKKLKYPEKQLVKIRNLVIEIVNIIREFKPSQIFIEEITQGKSRLGQKVLVGIHWILLNAMEPKDLDKVEYIEVKDWRSKLKIVLAPQDKKFNADARKSNRKHKAEAKKLGQKCSHKDLYKVITFKHKACQFVNKRFKLDLDVDQKSSDADKADAICIGVYGIEKDSL